jgi:hypothetical protein
VTGTAQGFRVTGQVLRGTANDSVPVADRIVVLHAVKMQGGRPIDSVTTDSRGRYSLSDPARDTSASYLVSVEHDGIGYFSQPMSAVGSTAEVASTLVVYDTSYTEPEISLLERHVIVRSLASDGTRRVVELLVLGNSGALTRIAEDSTRPVWQGAIPSNAIQFEIDQSDVGRQTVYRNGDSVAVVAALPPGEKQVLLSYLIPAGVRELSIPLDHPVERTMNVMLEDSSAAIAAGPLQFQGFELLDQMPFFLYSANSMPQGTEVAVRFAGQRWSITSLWWIVVPLTALSMALGLWRWLKRNPVQVKSQITPEALAAQIADMDRMYESRRDEMTDAERDAYSRRRAELKAQLSEMLARNTDSS